MKLRLGLAAFVALLTTGCFEDPPSSGTTADGTTTAPASTSAGTTTDVDDDDDDSTGIADSSSTGFLPPGTSTGFFETSVGPADTGTMPGDAISLFPDTCTTALWQAGPTTLDCVDEMALPPSLVAHEQFMFDETVFDSVIEVRLPPMADAPVDGYYFVDTSDFVNPHLRVEIACVDVAGCEANWLITAEAGDKELANLGGAAMTGGGVEPIELILPVQNNLAIHFNLSAPAPSGPADRLLLIDPRVEEL